MAQNESVDVVLVGAGIMSATLAVLLKELDPAITLEVVEAMDSGAAESSNPWNNAGTGHAGLCELNYTPQAADGSIDIKKAVHINTQFEVSRQFWAYLSRQGGLGDPRAFINPVPHLSYVEGDKGVAFLKKRFDMLKQHHAFAEMEYTEDKAVMNQWMPLMMPGRPADQHIAATRVLKGTDVNFGALTNQLLKRLGDSPDAQVKYSKKVTGLRRKGDGWTVTVKDVNSGSSRDVDARFVFLGAGGAALPLLQASGIPESKGFGGFPVSGQWLRCDNPEIVSQHQAKVYSQAADRKSVVDGKKSLLFGPYAGFTTKFLKHGSLMDLPLSVRMGNIGPMLAVARDNMDLTACRSSRRIRRKAASCSSAPSWSRPPTAAWPPCSAPRRVRRSPSRSCSSCSNAASPSRPKAHGRPSSRTSSRPARRPWPPMPRCIARSARTTMPPWAWPRKTRPSTTPEAQAHVIEERRSPLLWPHPRAWPITSMYSGALRWSAMASAKVLPCSSLPSTSYPASTKNPTKRSKSSIRKPR